MTNPEPELVTLRCPCDNPNPCCSQSFSSPKGLITVLFWECQGFTEEEMDEEATAFYQAMKDSFEGEE